MTRKNGTKMFIKTKDFKIEITIFLSAFEIKNYLKTYLFMNSGKRKGLDHEPLTSKCEIYYRKKYLLS